MVEKLLASLEYGFASLLSNDLRRGPTRVRHTGDRGDSSDLLCLSDDEPVSFNDNRFNLDCFLSASESS